MPVTYSGRPPRPIQALAEAGRGVILGGFRSLIHLDGPSELKINTSVDFYVLESR
jgi:hypothetical protein